MIDNIKDESLVFSRAHKKIKLSHSVIRKMMEFRQDTYRKNEAGGILLGRQIIESKDIIVDSLSTPLPGDQQTRCRFFRKAELHQELIDKAWHESNGTLNYLGEWHTHPESLPLPSNIDLRNWKRKLKQDKFFGDYLYFIIVGIQEILVWEGCKSAYNINKLLLLK